MVRPPLGSFSFSRSEVEPEILHFSQISRDAGDTGLAIL
jgi:hypothetical protein